MRVIGLRRRWQFGADGGASEPLWRDLAQQVSVPPLVGALLYKRGLTDVFTAQDFLRPRLSDLHDPALLPGAISAAKRLKLAVAQGQPIVVYGDYDVDGITASAILWHVLKLAGADVSVYIPHRVEEGYGLNSQALTILAKNKPVIVSVDCGITAVEPARVAKEAGVDLIITDHHEFASNGEAHTLPDAFALVHPRLKGSAYPFGDLCGAAVAFKLAWQFAKEHCGSQRLPDEFKHLLLDLLSLVALGTVADVVPLIGENRILAMHGLGQIKRTRFVGLNALIDATNLRNEKIDAYHVGFVLGPRINACGRMGHAMQAARLLTDANSDEAQQIAAFLTKENDRRRATERAILDEAKAMIQQHGYDQTDQRAIVLGKEGWHPGVIGIVASRLAEIFTRPVVVLSYQSGSDGTMAHGSARSVPGVSIYEAFEHCTPLLSSYGGHAMAAGMRMDAANIDVFRQRLVNFVNERLDTKDLVSTLNIDAQCTLDQVKIDLFEQIQRLAPFGRANPSPVLCARGLRNDRPAQRMGSAGRHLRMTLRDGGRSVSAVGFGMGDLAQQVSVGAILDVAFEPKISTWQGRRRAEVHIKDIRIGPS